MFSYLDSGGGILQALSVASELRIRHSIARKMKNDEDSFLSVSETHKQPEPGSAKS